MIKDTIYLSPSKLNLFQECPLCFWLQEVKKIHRPATPFPSLPSGMDNLIKKYFDRWREKKILPPEIQNTVKEKPLTDYELLRRWRFWKTGPKYEDKKNNYLLTGALDECFVEGDFYIPVDYKTRGFELKDDSLKYYQLQLDCYTFLLEAEGYKTKKYAYLIYYIPQKVNENGKVDFKVEAHKIETNPESAKNICETAVKTLRCKRPAAHSLCTFCSWGDDFLKYR